MGSARRARGAGVNLDSSQLAAVCRATSTRFSIITGGAGTGKTTLIRTIVETLEKRGEKVALAAFAGKAAARIREACQHPASTIHRLLGYDGAMFRTETLSDTALIIDEASMIDSLLMAEIVRRAPRRLVLVGDQAQLPPVGRGQPFHDLIALRPDLVSNLARCYRATEAIFQAASAIRSGGRPPMQASSEGETWRMRNLGDAERTHAEIVEYVAGGEAFDFAHDVILVARNGEADDEPGTVRGLNHSIADVLLPRDWSNPRERFKVGDRVINGKNMPELDCWNGTTGTVHAIDHDGGVWVRTDIPVIDRAKTTNERSPYYTSHVLFNRQNRVNLSLAYALTVHKAQGSQYRRVLFAAFNRDLHAILDRSLLYTAVTRAREACAVVGEIGAAFAAIDRVSGKRTVMQTVMGVE